MPENFDFGGEIVWRPTPETIERSNLTHFMREHGLDGFDALMQRSTTEVAWFTDAVLKFLDIRFRRPYDQVLDLSRGAAWPRWCVGAQLNIIDNCLDKYQAQAELAGRTAMIWEAEEGASRSLTYADLYHEVNCCANLLRSLGFGRGDALGLFMPMTPEIVIALLAVVKIGGIVLPLFSGYGVGAVASRLNDAGAAGLFTADGFFRRGQPVGLKAIADEAAAQVPTLRHMIVTRRSGQPVAMQAGRDVWWHEAVPAQPAEAETLAIEADE